MNFLTHLVDVLTGAQQNQLDEREVIIKNLELAYNINKRKQLSTTVKPNMVVVTTLLLEGRQTLPLYGTFKTQVPEDLRMVGIRAFHDWERNITFLYGIQDNRLIAIQNGYVEELEPPKEYVSYLSELKEYTKRIY